MKNNTIEFLKKYKNLFIFDNFKNIFEKDFADYLLSLESENEELAASLKKYKDNVNNGDLTSREIFIEHLKTRLLKSFNIYEIYSDDTLSKRPIFTNIALNEYKEIIDWIIPFDKKEHLSASDKFHILLNNFKEINSLGYNKAFVTLKEKYPIFIKERIVDGFKNTWYEYTDEDINDIYLQKNLKLSFRDKVDILVQKLFAEIYGLKDIDMLSYSAINEVGFQNNGNYIYVWSDEKIHLSFLKTTKTQAEVIQRRILTYAGQLDTSTQEILWHRKDTARITATMPPYTSSRVLRIRIFNVADKNFNDIIKNDKLKFLIKSLIKIGLTISLQGDLGSGKSTTMTNLLEILDDSIHIATIEDIFEQYNSKKYPEKSIVELQSTNIKNLNDALNTLLRLSVDAANVGEVREGEALAVLIQIAQAIGKSVFFTTHMASSEDFVPRGKNMLIATGKYFTEQAAVFDLVNYINIIFQHEIINNERYITPIVEIVPLINKSAKYEINMNTPLEDLQRMSYIEQIQKTPSNMYKLNTLISLEKGEYKFKNFPSSQMISKANKNPETKKYMEDLIRYMEKDLGKFKGVFENENN